LSPRTSLRSSRTNREPRGSAARDEELLDSRGGGRVSRRSESRWPATGGLGLALDSGMRRSELAGLMWADVNLTEGKVLVRQQLLSGGVKPVFIATKGKRARSIDTAPETVELLRTHKAHQAAVKMRRRQQYHDLGLVFAKEWSDGGRRHDVLGLPLDMNNIAERGFDEIVAAAGVARITIHGLRHTCASLLLAAGVPSKVVQERLGHKDISTTLDVYAHVLPGQQRDAARKLAALLFRH
jgi:integrase